MDHRSKLSSIFIKCSRMCGIAGLACCVTSQAASCLCSACPSCKNSTSAKIMYSIFLLFGSIVSMIMCTNGVEDALKKIPFLCTTNKTSDLEDMASLVGVDTGLDNGGVVDCGIFVGFQAVYRVCFGMTSFFWLFMILMIYVRNSRDPRASIQNGFWGIKFLIFIALIIAAFFIPQETFVPTWYAFGLIGGFIFILVQLVLYIDFAFNWNELWVGKMEDAQDDRERKCWFAMLLGTTFLIYVACAVGIGFMFHYYTGFYNGMDGSCGLHKFFLSFNMLICMIITVISILPKIQEANPSAGLLQSAIISAYVLYLTWSAMASSPDKICNPSIDKILNGTTTNDQPTPSVPSTINGYDGQSIIGLIIFFIAVLYSSIRNSSQV
jgi:hypothetical protein